MLYVIMLYVIMLYVVMLDVVMLSVVAPKMRKTEKVRWDRVEYRCESREGVHLLYIFGVS